MCFLKSEEVFSSATSFVISFFLIPVMSVLKYLITERSVSTSETEKQSYPVINVSGYEILSLRIQLNTFLRISS